MNKDESPHRNTLMKLDEWLDKSIDYLALVIDSGLIDVPTATRLRAVRDILQVDYIAFAKESNLYPGLHEELEKKL